MNIPSHSSPEQSAREQRRVIDPVTAPSQSASASGQDLIQWMLEVRNRPLSPKESLCLVGGALGAGALIIALAVYFSTGFTYTDFTQKLLLIGIAFYGIRSFTKSRAALKFGFAFIGIVAAIVLLCAILNGNLPFSFACLVIAGACAIGWWWLYLNPQVVAEPELAKDPESRPAFWPPWPLTLLMVVSMGARYLETGSLVPPPRPLVRGPTLPSAVHSTETPRPLVANPDTAIAQATSRYWRGSVAILYEAPPPPSAPSFEKYVDSTNLRMLQQLAAVRALDKRDVDPELVQCVELVVEKHEQFVAWIIAHRSQLVQLNGDRAAQPLSQEALDFFTELVDTPKESIPAEFQEFAGALQELDAALGDLEALQPQLSARYPSVTFDWPGE